MAFEALLKKWFPSLSEIEEEGGEFFGSEQDIIKQVRALDLQLRKRVNQNFLGQWKATFKGQGMTFADFREYVPGDDVRHISWILTARSGRTYVKQYEEERELSVVLVTDVSPSMRFGGASWPKHYVASLVGAALAWSALRSKDLVGLLLFGDGVQHWVPPKKSRSHLLRLIRDMLWVQSSCAQSDLNPSLAHLNKVLKRRSLIFIISDFLDMKDLGVQFKTLRTRHDIYPILIADSWESALPDCGLVTFKDAESGKITTLDTHLFEVQQNYLRESQSSLKRWEDFFKKNNVPLGKVNCHQNWLNDLERFLRTL